MATTDNSLQVINSMTESQLDSLKDSNGKIPDLANQLIMTEDEASGISLPIGAIFPSAIPITDARVHLLDGSTISQTGVYETFANLIKSLVSSGYNINCSQTEFDADITATGNCGKFVVDDTAGTIRLPKITTFIQGLTSITNIGESLSAGIPNITGKWTSGWNVTVRGFHSLSASGAFYDSYTAGLHDGAGRIQGTDDNNTGTKGYPWFDAKRGETKSDGTIKNDVYGKSDTVQPNATQYPYYIVLANGYKSFADLQIDNIISDLNNKQDKITEGNGISIENGVVSADHPVGSYHICVSGSEDPASCFGGNWTQIASNIVLPLGDTAFVDAMGTEHGILGYGVKIRLADSSKPTAIINLGVDSSGMMYGVYGIPSGSNYLNPVFSNLYARLNSASNAIRVDIWRRDP